MNRAEVRELIDEMIAEEGELPAGKSGAVLNLSSLELVRLLIGLEDRLEVEFDDATVLNSKFGAVDDIVDLVLRYV